MPASNHAVTVFASSSRAVAPLYFDVAAEVGRAIALQNWRLIYGGNRVGPMGAMADAARQAGGQVVGVTPQMFIDNGEGDDACHELVIADSMRHRKQIMDERCHAFLTLPGGVGTLEEFFEAAVGRQLNVHRKPVVLLNVAGFYDPLIEMMHRGIAQGFVRSHAWQLIYVANDVNSAISLLRPNASEIVRPIAARPSL